MSSSVASIVALALYALALAPLAWLSSSKGNRGTAAGYVGLVLVVAIYHTGIFQSASLARTDTVVQVLGAVDEGRCREILDLLERSNLRVDRSDPAAPKLVGQGADQVPAEVAEMVIGCAGTVDADPQPTTTAARGPAGVD